MKTLLVLRHAKSSWSNAGLADHDRPLNKRGRHDAPRMGELVAELALAPQQILSSTAERTRATADAVAERAGYRGEIVLDENLYGASAREIVSVIAAQGGARVDRLMVVVHNPGAEELIAKLTGREERFPTAALACVELPIDAWDELRLDTDGRLAGLWRPKTLE